MVTIPTSRDVGFSSPRSGRAAPSGPTPMVGRAMQGLGQSIVQVGFSLQDLQEREQRDLMNSRSNEVSTSLTRFLADEEQRFLKARDESSESGIGFTRQFMEGHQQRANEFAKQNFAGLSEDAQTGYLNNILSRGNSLFEKANAYETQAKTNYYDRTTNGNLDVYRTDIKNNAANFEDLKRQGLEAINSADMPEPWKAERRAQWEADAAESKWQWKYQQDPQTAIRDIKGVKVDAKGLSAAIQQTAQQLGIDPLDLATVMSYETGGTFDPWIKGPTTKWGTHRGLIQWGEPQAAKYGVTQDMPIEQQVAAAGQYLRDAGVKPGMGLIDIYSAVNAGAPGRYDRSDHKAGGAPGTVADKVMYQMEGHKQKAAALLGGTYTPVPGDPDLDAIPFDRRQQLASWGETQYSQQVTQQRAATNDNYKLLIATQPDQVSETQILSDPLLDNGDKASLITSLRTAVKDSGAVNAVIGALGAGGDASINPFDTDQVKAANGAYDKLMGAAGSPEEQAAITSDFVTRTGYIPKPVQAQIRNGALSTDAAAFSQSMEQSLALQQAAPGAFSSFEGAEAVRKKMDLYRAFTRDMGYSAEEAAGRLIRANDPQYAAQRDALMKSKAVKDAVDGIDADAVANIFDRGIMGSGYGSANPKLGPTPMAEAAMVTDYRSIFEEALVDSGGDVDAATTAANTRFQRFYGVSDLTSMGSNVVVKNPPEKAYPAGADGTHGYIRTQALEALKAEGIEAEDVYLNPDLETDKDIRAGRLPAYRLMYVKDGKLETFPLAYAPDPSQEKVKAKENAAKAVQDAEARMIENRKMAMQEQQAADEAMQQTVGPDWMKARAAETARDQMQQRQVRDRQSSNPGPIGGMGTQQQINDMINAGISN